MATEYLYCVIDTDQPVHFESGKVGSQPGELSVLGDGGLGVVVGPCDPQECGLSRQNLIGHQKVMEEAMARFTVLPIRYGTMAEAETLPASLDLIRDRLLERRRGELEALMSELAGLQELSVKVLFKDLDRTLKELGQTDPEIKRLAARIAGKSEIATRPERIRLGGLVQERLGELRSGLGDELAQDLQMLAVRAVRHDTVGDRMVLNGAFLVRQTDRDAFDELLDERRLAHPELVFRYFGPLAPSSFVNLVISWD